MEWVVGFLNALAKLMKFELIFGKNLKNEQNIFLLFLVEIFVKAIKLSLLQTYIGFQVYKHVSIAKKVKLIFFCHQGAL